MNDAGVTPPRSNRNKGIGPGLIAVFFAAIVIPIIITRNRATSDNPVTSDDAVVLIAPSASDSVAPGAIEFVWRAQPGARNYTLEVLADDGRSLFMSITADTVVHAPAAMPRAPSARWSVRAHLDDGTERRSESRVLLLQ